MIVSSLPGYPTSETRTAHRLGAGSSAAWSGIRLRRPQIREPAVAGLFYPDDPLLLQQQVDKLLAQDVAVCAAPKALNTKWTADIGGRLTQPVVAGGMVFVASIDAHTVHALDAANGERLDGYDCVIWAVGRAPNTRDLNAEAAGIAIIPDCGQVPGMGTSLSVYAMSLLDETDEIMMWDGGNPLHPVPTFNYILTFNIAGLCCAIAVTPNEELRKAMQRAGGYDNHLPRAQQAQLEGWGARSVAAHQNGFETFAPFAAAPNSSSSMAPSPTPLPSSTRRSIARTSAASPLPSTASAPSTNTRASPGFLPR